MVEMKNSTCSTINFILGNHKDQKHLQATRFLEDFPLKSK